MLIVVAEFDADRRRSRISLEFDGFRTRVAAIRETNLI
jgi:hypothetical protein